MEAIVLAGGLGTRLRSVINDRPKVMALVSGRPFLEYVILFLKKNGVTKFIFSLGYQSDKIIEFVTTSNLDIDYEFSIENIQLGTGGAIKKSLEFTNNENILVVNSDTYFNFDLMSMMLQHKLNNADFTIALKLLKNFDRYGTVEINDQLRISSFIEKKYTSDGFINAGYMILNRRKFNENTNNYPVSFSVETDLLQKISKLNIYGFKSTGFFIDIGIPEDYNFAQQNLVNIINI
jgi:D-glycero-alpha-D-manno-heptose 1-phosphate guanylyltransferase